MITTRAHASDAETALEREGRQLARQVAAEGIVLLGNDGALPLAPCRIALFGCGASMTVSGGTGSGEVNVRHTVDVREGLLGAGFDILTNARLDAYARTWERGRKTFIAEQRANLLKLNLQTIADIVAMDYLFPYDEPITPSEIEALNTDACIYVLARQSGEGSDRTDEPGSYRLTQREMDDIALCARSFRTTILVLNVGAPIDLSFCTGMDGLNAVVLMGQLGMEGGHALADILTGRQSPSGRLAVTWPETLSQVPFSNVFGLSSPDKENADYAEGVFVGYRYYESFDVKPAFPFGHGLSYARFDEQLDLAAQEGDAIALSVSVSNCSEDHAGKHVVQLYAQCPEGSIPKESVRLVAFAKTGALAPGACEQVNLRFPLRELASYDERMAETALEEGDYILALDDSCASTTPVAVVHVPERLVLERHRNLCASNKRISSLQPSRTARWNASDLPAVEIDPTAITPIRHEYGKADTPLSEIDELVNALSNKQALQFCVGTGMFSNKRGFSVPGAVGHSTAVLAEYGVPNVEFCDGPAGIRLQWRSAKNAKGKIKPIDPPISFYELLPKPAKRFIFGDPDNDEVLYQFVTGFPTASCIAQTWNTDLARSIGETIAREMDAYGVTYWLAPAMNIVRNPLCGRNFEYYSEDPVVTGKIAAAVTSGVQSRPGTYACLKHFAANNQETARNIVSANVDERVLREIYLRGFEIAVREAQPASIMAAYNKINGVYCTESAELLTDILRSEWGFGGLVMTDWLATGRKRANSCKAIEAGVDLIMPGGRMVLASLKRGLKSGLLSRTALNRSCSRVLAKTLLARFEDFLP